MTKYSFSMLLIAGLCVLLIWILAAYDRIAGHLNGDLLKEKDAELKEAEQKLKKLQTQAEELKERVFAHSVPTQEETPKSDIELLRKKVRAA